MKSNEEIIQTAFSENDQIARVIYENIFQRDHRGVYRAWKDLPYMAPETREGFAGRACIVAANEVRSYINAASHLAEGL